MVAVVVREIEDADFESAVAVINEAFMADAFFKKPEFYNRTSIQVSRCLLFEHTHNTTRNTQPTTHNAQHTKHDTQQTTPRSTKQHIAATHHAQHNTKQNTEHYGARDTTRNI
eukprot:TRINITY_DN3329_c0_g1_i1.p2 TRINITY_DN3329_c0_g1~~TRINITY_DN3329_c0_g1_i1.p2  ORF type:complete len:113 (-),score=27.59 TRINITY_DN3329_c0_g1_i1:53-391(-)